MPPDAETHSADHVRQLHELSITDDCTGLYNARHLNFMLDTEIYRCERHSLQFSLLDIAVLGVDELRDSVGSLMLNKLFAQVAEPIRAGCRLIDLAFHYGGGEFVVLLPAMTKEQVAPVLRQIHGSLIYKTWLVEQGHHLRLNVSMGVVTWPDDGSTKAELLHSLDETMYLAKKSTRGAKPADQDLVTNLRGSAPNKLKASPQFRSALIATLAVALFAWFIWPTRYRYDHLKLGAIELPVRIDRFSGRAEALYPSGWKILNGSATPISK